MSTNTTSTNDRIEADSLTLSPAQEESVQKASASPFVATLPDPAVIARLANEFFAALPGAAEPPGASVPVASPNEVDLRVPSGPIPRTSVPDYPREMFSFPGVPNSGSVPGLPQMSSSPPTGAMGEADFRAIADSLAGVMALVPRFPAAAPASEMPGSSSSFLDGEKSGPWNAAPQFPPVVETFFFPGVPAIPSSPPTAPPSGSGLAAASSSTATSSVPSTPTAPARGSDLAAASSSTATASVPSTPTPATAHQTPSSPGDEGRTDPWAAVPNFPNEVFSFPRVPGMSAPGIPEQRVPEPIVSQPSVPASSTSPDKPPSANAPQSIPAIPNAVQSR